MKKDVAERWRLFIDVRKIINNLNVCFMLAYPAVLCFTRKAEKVRFVDPQAMDLLSVSEGKSTENRGG